MIAARDDAPGGTEASGVTELQTNSEFNTLPSAPAGARLDTHAFPNETRRALFAPDFTRASPHFNAQTGAQK